jgi:23S rRNA pseudouridine1911/1915/1917 synthase
VFLAGRLPEWSRARLQALIAGGRVAIAGREAPKPSLRVRAGDRIVVDVPPPEPSTIRPEPIPLNVVHEDADVLVIDKPAGLAVHPGAGRRTGTLAHAVLAHAPDLTGIGGELRPGIVHRLDKDTSGLIVVAKNERALRRLQQAIQLRLVRREYTAIVHGRVRRAGGTIDAPIGRDPRHRTRMAVVASGRRAVTHFRVAECFADASLLEVRLDTGRTHQIRVHCASIGHPLIGDPVYGRGVPSRGLARQALHAGRLSFPHPTTGAAMAFESPLPEDLRALVRRLRTAGASASSRRGL